ncbi:MAG: hypothetical protein DRJ67_05080 [Thermoprotei archaeon]|nr:MAG: hypothetical protein DRJ67_05080 [Thermoprotei archaeon]
MAESSNLSGELRRLLQGLASAGPASNILTQILFILPEKARTLLLAYPDVMEHEDELLSLFKLRYTEKGFLDCPYEGLAYHLRGLYHTLFSLLSDPESRSALLDLAGLDEEEFRKIDPLRLWLEVAISHLADARPSSLKVLSLILSRLEESEYVYLGEEFLEKLKGVSENVEVDLEVLRRFGLLYQETPSQVYRRECPLLLDTYSDLRVKVKEGAKES